MHTCIAREGLGTVIASLFLDNADVFKTGVCRDFRIELYFSVHETGAAQNCHITPEY